MKKKTTVYEDMEEKQEKRLAKQREYQEKHTVFCPHCKKNVLDHMTKCPHCGEKLTPVGYTPMDEKKIRKIKIIGYIVGFAVLAVVLVCIYAFR